MNPGHTSINLSRLSKQQAVELVRKKAGRELPEAVLSQICERAGGVPLFIEEFTRMVIDSGLLEKSDMDSGELKALVFSAIPATLQEMMLVRLDRLQGDLNIVQLAASAGRSFSFDLLRDVSGFDDEGLREELSKLVKGDILIGKGRPPNSTYVFKHILLQDALYNSLVKSKRRQIHERIAESLKVRQAKTGDVLSEIFAHHLTEAGMIDQSINHWLQAGLRSQEQFANVEAINHFRTGLQLLCSLPESEQKDRQELLLLSPLGSAYQATLGYSAPVVGPLFTRALELSQKIGQADQQFEIMWGNWTWHLVRGDLKLCVDLANEMMSFAADTADSGMLMEAHVAPAVTFFYRGDFAACRKYCEAAISDYEDAERCRYWESKTGQNSSVVIRCYLTLALWHLGYSVLANRLIEQTLGLARQCNPFSLGHALHFANWFYQYCRQGDRLLSLAEEQITLAEQKGFALWHASGIFLKGAGLVIAGRNDEGLQFMERGLLLFKTANATITLAAQLGVLAEAYITAKRFDDAKRVIDEGLSLADKHEDHYQEAELHRLYGALQIADGVHRVGVANQASAEKSFCRSMELARSQQSKAWLLRSAISLARLRLDQNRIDEANNAVATIYDTFTEGFDLPDLLEARALSGHANI